MRNKFLYLIAILAFGIIFSACKKNETPAKTPEQIQLEKLAGTWEVPSSPASGTVTVESVDVTTDWQSFNITFSDGNFTTSGSAAPEVWPSSGNWSFATGDVNTIQRGDGVDVSINVSESTLTMSFNYTDPGGRLSGTEGNWVFNNLVKQ